MIGMASNESRKQANKKKGKQKVVSAKDKCQFGLDVHSFIMLKHGRHSQQDLCMDMWASV